MKLKKNIDELTLEDFYRLAPKEIRHYLDRCKITPQSKIWHPEGDVYIHTKIVFNRARHSKNLNLMLAALFHDLGKVDETEMNPDVTGEYTSRGHEEISTQLVKKYKDWILELGGNPSLVEYVVENHMRVKYIDEMRPGKQLYFKRQPYFSYVKKFSTFDNMQINFDYDFD